MSSVTEWVDDVFRGVATGLVIGLALMLAFGAVTLLLAHFCVVPVAPWCKW